MASSLHLHAARSLGVIALVALGACNEPSEPFRVDLTVSIDDSIDSEALARITTLSFRATGDESYTRDVVLGRGISRTERLAYYPLAGSRSIVLAVSALDAAGAHVGDGTTGAITLAADRATAASATLFADVADGGVALDSGQPDGSGETCVDEPSSLDGGTEPARCALGNSPVIDGLLDEWSDATFIPLNHANAALVFGGKPWSGTQSGDDADLSGAFALRWDRDFLYVAARIVDDIRCLDVNAPGYYADDAIEVYLDGDGAGTMTYNGDDHQLLVRVDGEVQEAKNGTIGALTIGGLRIKTADTGVAGHWTFEMAVPWSALGTAPVKPGRQIGFDVQLDDCDTPAAARLDHALTWIATPDGSRDCKAPNCSTAMFGRVQLTSP